MFTNEEEKLLKKLDRPRKIQEYIEEKLEYDFEENDEIVRSFRKVFKDKKAHCLDGALFASSILYYHGHPPLMVCIEARDLDHNIAIYKENGRWGSIAQSRDENLKWREPNHRNIKNLVMSYFPYYWDYYSKGNDITNLTMRGYAKINLDIFGKEWIFSEKNLKFIEDHLWDIKYRFLFARKDKSKFYKVDRKTEKILLQEQPQPI